MKQHMKIGEYSVYDKKNFRCVPAEKNSQQQRCNLCDLNGYGLCPYVSCQPDERDDHKAVIFKLTRKYRKEQDNG